MRMVNRTSYRLSTPEFGGLDIGPGEVVEIADGYCRGRALPNGSRKPSIVEQVLPGLEPEDHAIQATWKELPSEPEVRPAPTVEQVAVKLEAEGTPPAVAALLAAEAVEPLAPLSVPDVAPRRRGRPRREG